MQPSKDEIAATLHYKGVQTNAAALDYILDIYDRGYEDACEDATNRIKRALNPKMVPNTVSEPKGL